MGLLKKKGALTQAESILKLLRERGSKGAPNHELARYALKYTSVISELREDGYTITAVRQKLKNGRASNTWQYYLNEQDN